jgi:hypothetical protein
MDEMQSPELEAINDLFREGRRYTMAKFPPCALLSAPPSAHRPRLSATSQGAA